MHDNELETYICNQNLEVQMTMTWQPCSWTITKDVDEKAFVYYVYVTSTWLWWRHVTLHCRKRKTRQKENQVEILITLHLQSNNFIFTLKKECWFTEKDKQQINFLNRVRPLLRNKFSRFPGLLRTLPISMETEINSCWIYMYNKFIQCSLYWNTLKLLLSRTNVSQKPYHLSLLKGGTKTSSDFASKECARVYSCTHCRVL